MFADSTKANSLMTTKRKQPIYDHSIRRNTVYDLRYHGPRLPFGGPIDEAEANGTDICLEYVFLVLTSKMESAGILDQITLVARAQNRSFHPVPYHETVPFRLAVEAVGKAWGHAYRKAKERNEPCDFGEDGILQALNTLPWTRHDCHPEI